MEKSSDEYRKYLEECLSYIEKAHTDNQITDKEYADEKVRIKEELLEFEE